MDYTQLIEQLRAPDNALCNAGAKAIEALQARVADAERMQKYYSDYCNLTAAERDAALAKLKELEAKPSPTALELMREYSNGKKWALEEAAKICDSTPPLPFRPSIEAAWAIRKLKEGL